MSLEKIIIGGYFVIAAVLLSPIIAQFFNIGHQLIDAPIKGSNNTDLLQIAQNGHEGLDTIEDGYETAEDIEDTFFWFGVISGIIGAVIIGAFWLGRRS